MNLGDIEYAILETSGQVTVIPKPEKRNVIAEDLNITPEYEDKKKPYTDDELTDILKEKGYPIARRTVAKYRQQLNIPVARLRK